ncbi:phage/plasmid primase, P4 family [uncultured Methanolobus sp.]|uniref:DNA primase family protein n=1 Tax=uncultured Methanolobus sp. TaxID=218300 RepID=UPI0029C9A7CA|nr:phage/plasmid primase, P4 family [uncultured Methanolobus sp.]
MDNDITIDKHSDTPSGDEEQNNAITNFAELNLVLVEKSYDTSNSDLSFTFKEVLKGGMYKIVVKALYKDIAVTDKDFDYDIILKADHRFKKEFIGQVEHDIGKAIKKDDVKDLLAQAVLKFKDETECKEHHAAYILLENERIQKLKNNTSSFLKTDEMGRVYGIFVHNLATALMKDYTFLTLDDTHEVLYYEGGKYRRGGENLIRMLVQRELLNDSTEKYQREVLNYIKHETLIERKHFNLPCRIINFKNGLYEVETHTFHLHTPEHLTTMQLDVDYDETATCPKIEKFMSEILPKDNDRDGTLEFIAYCMINENNMRKAFMGLGNGKNGKTQLFKLVMKLFEGQFSMEAIQDLERDKFAAHNTCWKMLNIMPDLPSEPLDDSKAYKTIVGNDGYIKGEAKYMPGYLFRPTIRMMFMANQAPWAHFENNDAYYDRWLLVEFKQRFEGQSDNKNLFNEISTDEEMEGFAQLLIRHLHDLLERGEYANEKDLQETKKIYLIRADPVRAFVLDRLEEDDEGGRSSTVKDVYDCYKQWCEESDIASVKSGPELKKRLKKLYGWEHKQLWDSLHGGKVCWVGVKIKDEWKGDGDDSSSAPITPPRIGGSGSAPFISLPPIRPVATD